MSEHEHAKGPAAEGAPAPAAPTTKDAASAGASDAGKGKRDDDGRYKREELVRAGWFGWQVPATVGATTLVMACMLGMIYAQQSSRMTSTPRMSTLEAVLWTLLGGPVFAALGVAALWIGAKAAGKRLGDVRLGASRMLGAVGVAMVVWAVGPFVVKIEPVELLLSALVYAGVVWSVFRVNRRTLAIVVGAHLLLCALLIVFIAYVLPRLF